MTSSRNLECFGGGAAPEGLSEDLAALGIAGPLVANAVRSAVQALIGSTLPKDADEIITQIARDASVDASSLARVSMAARILVRAASRLDVGVNAFKSDLAVLTGEEHAILRRVLVESFEGWKGTVQGELLGRTVAEHGKVLADFDWRLETITASNHGTGFHLPLVTLTLKYEENGEMKAVTLQALPSVVRRLKSVLEGLVD